MRVAARTAFPLVNPAPRVRIAGYVERLRALGIDLDLKPALSADEYRRVVSGPGGIGKATTMARGAARFALERIREQQADNGDQELLLIHRFASVVPVPGFDPPRRLDLYDFDDALYLGYAGKKPGLARVRREPQRWRSYVQRARVVLAGNPELAAHASALASRVEVVPSCVEPAAYQVHHHEQREPMVVGWIGSASTSAYLEPVIRALDRINADRVRARLIAVGATSPLDRPWAETRPWSLESEAEELAGFDVGVMPLPDTDWARGKCGYKLLQYFASGVPGIASPVGVAPAMLADGRGLAAGSEEQWRAALDELLESSAMRSEMGAAARRYVIDEYSYEAWAPELARLIRELS